MTRSALLTIAAGLILLTYLLIESRGPDQARQTRVHAALQSMQLHDAELNREVLLARAGLLPHYDSLPASSRMLKADLDSVRAEAARLESWQARLLDEEIASLAAALTDKLTLIEYLKSDNAVLRNSVAFFAHSMRRRGTQDLPRRAASTAAMEGTALSHVVMQVIGSPDPEVTAEARAVLARVTALSRSHPELEPLTAHARLILEVIPRVDDLLAKIAASPTAARAEALQRALLESAAQTEAHAQRFRVVMFIVALLLLGYVVYQVARLRARTRELRRQEMQLIQANKMTSLGMLVSGVAHEVNNPNQLVLMNASVLLSAWDDLVRIVDAQRHEDQPLLVGGLPFEEMRKIVPPLIRQIGDGAHRIDRIIGDLKDFARPGPRSRESFQLNDVVDHALRLLRHLVHKRTDRFKVELAPDMPSLEGDPQQIEQVVVNLVINALEALPNRTGSVSVITAFDAATNTISIEVRDTGVGISDEHVSRLGQPFFTTKGASGGTGLGLAIASSLVRLHHGRLWFVSKSGQGTRAIVEFHPFARPAVPAHAAVQGSLT